MCIMFWVLKFLLSSYTRKFASKKKWIKWNNGGVHHYRNGHLDANTFFLFFVFLNWQWIVKRNHEKKIVCIALIFYILFNQFLCVCMSFSLSLSSSLSYFLEWLWVEVKWPVRDEKSIKNIYTHNAQRCEKSTTNTTTRRKEMEGEESGEKIVQTHTMWIMIAHHSMFYDSFISFFFIFGKKLQEKTMNRKREREREKERGVWEVKRHNTLYTRHSIQSDTVYCITEWNVICKNCTGDSFWHSSAIVKCEVKRILEIRVRRRKNRITTKLKYWRQPRKESARTHTPTKWPFRI